MNQIPAVGRNEQSKGGNMEILAVAGFVAAWIVLQMWVLPRFGVQT